MITLLDYCDKVGYFLNKAGVSVEKQLVKIIPTHELEKIIQDTKDAGFGPQMCANIIISKYRKLK
jgi:hypothetical protein